MKAEVSVVTLHPQSVAITGELPGRTTASLTAEVRPQVSGIIQARLFQEGGLVKAGDALYQLDPAELYRESLRIRKFACRASIFGFGLAA